MKTGFIGYFNNAPEVSSGKKLLLIILGILLFISLVLFGPVMALQQTVFNPDCVASYVNDLDVPALTNSWLKENVSPTNPVLAKSAELAIINFEPQIKELMRSSVRNIYAYILDSLKKGKLLDTIAAQKPVVENLAAHIQAIMDLPALSPVFQMLGVNSESITKNMDAGQINGLFDMLAQLAALKSFVVILMSSMIPLLLLMIVLVIAIVLIARRPGFMSGELGLISATSGALQFIIILPAGGLGKSLVSQFNLPPLIRDWLLRLVQDFNSIVMIYGGALLLAGIALIVIYYALKRVKHDNGS
ncbi:MAG: hypothetical protein PHY03_01240 [Dehalococcoidia bacterium]|nr:hypothetical protein [Dehalococcoidia bacterium]